MNSNVQAKNPGTLSIALGELEGRLNEVLKEVRRLRNQARTLEEENQRLRAFMYSPLEGENGRQQLLRLYQEGFHVCPLHFARVRDGQGCLFCEGFLEKKGAFPYG
ncbi:MAG: DNA replication initiation control protein YabA [Clostridia bacterium]|nr:DNA replication initiation control protein YabA [Clostridia bacterium]